MLSIFLTQFMIEAYFQGYYNQPKGKIQKDGDKNTKNTTQNKADYLNLK